MILPSILLSPTPQLRLVIPSTPPLPGDEPGDQTVNISLTSYSIRLNGQHFPNNASALDASFFEITWLDSGTDKSAIVFVAFADNNSVPGLGNVDSDNIFVLSGDPMPTANSVADWETFDGDLTGIGFPTGVFGEKTNIALTNLGASVTENDAIRGTGGSGNFNAVKGNDVIKGLNGKDKLLGGTGRDTLDGGNGNGKMIGGAGKDTFAFSSGKDKITDFTTDDHIDLDPAKGIRSFNDLLNNHTVEVNGNLVITDNAGYTLTLNGITEAELQANDFLF